MIVDDHPAMVLALKSLLHHQLGFEVIDVAHDGKSCLAIAKDVRPDMMILDLDMPHTDGFDLIRRLKLSLPNLKLLILSSLEEKVYGGRVRSLGAHGYLNKSASGKIIHAAAVAVSQGYSFFSITPNGLADTCDNTKLNSISDREFQVLKFLGKGCGNHEISQHLHISNKTVATYKSRLYDKIGVNNIADLINFCKQNKVCDN